MPSHSSKEYVLSVETNSLQEAIRQISGALYDLLDGALMSADDEEESAFDRFARETLDVLARHPEQLSSDGLGVDDAEPGEDAWHETEDEDDSGAAEIVE